MASRYIVYGRSTCIFCKKANDLLKEQQKESVFFDFSEDPEAIEDAKNFYESKTVPIILENDLDTGVTRVVGGYIDLKEHLGC